MKEKKFSYHWVIVIACFLMMAATVGIVVNCFSILIPDMMSDLSYSASRIQLIGLIVTFANLISGVFIGKVMAKLGLKLTLPIYAVLMCGGLAARGLCYEFYQFFISSLFCGVKKAQASPNWTRLSKPIKSAIVFPTNLFSFSKRNSGLPRRPGVLFDYFRPQRGEVVWASIVKWRVFFVYSDADFGWHFSA